MFNSMSCIVCLAINTHNLNDKHTIHIYEISTNAFSALKRSTPTLNTGKIKPN